MPVPGNALEHGVLQPVAQHGEALGVFGQACGRRVPRPRRRPRCRGRSRCPGGGRARDGRRTRSARAGFPCARRARRRPWARRACGRSCCRGRRRARRHPPESCRAPARHPHAAATPASCAICAISAIGCMRAELVIGVHDADQHRLGAQRAADVVGADDAARRRRAGSVTATPSALQLLGGREHRRMLDGAGDDVLARRAWPRASRRGWPDCRPRCRRW